MTTRQTYIDRRLAMLYSVPFPFKGDWVKHEFPPESGRSGILTQISMLSMFSHPARSSPTKRGVALREIFLCLPTPEPLNDVDFSEVNDPKNPIKTLRERPAHNTRTCAACHQMTDPIGLSLENFDTIGGYRTTENGEPIDVSASIQGKTFSGAQGSVSTCTTIRSIRPAWLASCIRSRGLKIPSSLISGRLQGVPGFRVSAACALLKSMAVSDSFYAVGPPGNPSPMTNDSK